MKRNKIKKKYLKIIKPCNDNNLSNKIDNIEKIIIKCLISFLLIILMLFWDIIPIIILSIFGINIDNLNNNTIYIISFINCLLLILILIKIYYKDIKNNLIKYFKYNFKTNFKTSIKYWGVGLSIMYISNIIIAIITNGQLAENEEAIRSLIDINPIYMAFQIVIYAPLVEELIFRKSFREFINNKWIYVLVSGIVFGGLHAISSITDAVSLLYLIPYCSLGIVFGLLYYKTNNIFSTIIVHAIHNSLALILYLVAI